MTQVAKQPTKGKPTQKQAPVAIFELVDQAESGFIKIGTEKLTEPVQLTYPAYRVLLTESSYKVDLREGGYSVERIRHILGCNEIHANKQEEKGFAPNPLADQIRFKDGRLIVAREGKNIGTYDYLKKSSMNESSPDRLPDAPAIYREIFPEVEEQKVHNSEFDFADAVTYIKQAFILKQGADGTAYDEHKVEAFANLFNVVAETIPGKINGLVATAKLNPVVFLQKARSFEQGTLLELEHAERLQVIKVDQTNTHYLNKDKVICSYSDKLSKEQKLKHVAAYFMSFEGAGDYKEFLVELNHAKENNL
jgi:hypothetical protein